jgi:hypothetical protein
MSTRKLWPEAHRPHIGSPWSMARLHSWSPERGDNLLQIMQGEAFSCSSLLTDAFLAHKGQCTSSRSLLHCGATDGARVGWWTHKGPKCKVWPDRKRQICCTVGVKRKDRETQQGRMEMGRHLDQNKRMRIWGGKGSPPGHCKSSDRDKKPGTGLNEHL